MIWNKQQQNIVKRKHSKYFTRTGGDKSLSLSKIEYPIDKMIKQEIGN